jgi:uncharacterized protein (DUF305 family)
MIRSLAALAFVLTLALAPGGGEAQTMQHDAHGQAAHGASPGSAALVEANDRMMKAMMSQPTGDADRDFAVMMLEHHRGAVEMARIELQHGRDPILRVLAQKVVTAQEEEIRQLESWLAAHK